MKGNKRPHLHHSLVNEPTWYVVEKLKSLLLNTSPSAHDLMNDIPSLYLGYHATYQIESAVYFFTNLNVHCHFFLNKKPTT